MLTAESIRFLISKCIFLRGGPSSQHITILEDHITFTRD